MSEKNGAFLGSRFSNTVTYFPFISITFCIVHEGIISQVLLFTNRICEKKMGKLHSISIFLFQDSSSIDVVVYLYILSDACKRIQG